MKKTLFVLLAFVALFAGERASAQFRSIPGIVTDSFKIKYPAATDVNWSDKISAFQATFRQNGESFTTRYTKDGHWMYSTKRLAKDAIPAPVKDGLSKSKYAGAEWEIRIVTESYLPGNVTQYTIQVAKSDLQKKNLLFSSEGQLLKDNATL